MWLSARGLRERPNVAGERFALGRESGPRWAANTGRTMAIQQWFQLEDGERVDLGAVVKIIFERESAQQPPTRATLYALGASGLILLAETSEPGRVKILFSWCTPEYRIDRSE